MLNEPRDQEQACQKLSDSDSYYTDADVRWMISNMMMMFLPHFICRCSLFELLKFILLGCCFGILSSKLSGVILGMAYTNCPPIQI